MSIAGFIENIKWELELILENTRGVENLLDKYSDLETVEQHNLVQKLLEFIETNRNPEEIARYITSQYGSADINSLTRVVETIIERRNAYVTDNPSMDNIFTGDQVEQGATAEVSPELPEIDANTGVREIRTSDTDVYRSHAVTEELHQLYVDLYEALLEDNPDIPEELKLDSIYLEFQNRGVLIEELERRFNLTTDSFTAGKLNHNSLAARTVDTGLVPELPELYGWIHKKHSDSNGSAFKDYQTTYDELHDLPEETIKKIDDIDVAGPAMRKFAKDNNLIIASDYPKMKDSSTFSDIKNELVADDELFVLAKHEWEKGEKFGNFDKDDMEVEYMLHDRQTGKQNLNQRYIFPEGVETAKNKLAKLHNEIISNPRSKAMEDKFTLDELSNYKVAQITGDTGASKGPLFIKQTTKKSQDILYEIINSLYHSVYTGKSMTEQSIFRALLNDMTIGDSYLLGTKSQGVFERMYWRATYSGRYKKLIKHLVKNGDPDELGKRWGRKRGSATFLARELVEREIKNSPGSIAGLSFVAPDGTPILTTITSSDASQRVGRGYANSIGVYPDAIVSNIIDFSDDATIGFFPDLISLDEGGSLSPTRFKNIKGNLMIRTGDSFFRQVMKMADKHGFVLSNGPINYQVAPIYTQYGFLPTRGADIQDLSDGKVYYDGPQTQTRIPVPEEIRNLTSSVGIDRKRMPGRFSPYFKIIWSRRPTTAYNSEPSYGDMTSTSFEIRKSKNILDTARGQILISMLEGNYDTNSSYLSFRRGYNERDAARIRRSLVFDTLFSFEGEADSAGIMKLFAEKIDNLDAAEGMVADINTLNVLNSGTSTSQPAIQPSHIAGILVKEPTFLHHIFYELETPGDDVDFLSMLKTHIAERTADQDIKIASIENLETSNRKISYDISGLDVFDVDRDELADSVLEYVYSDVLENIDEYPEIKTQIEEARGQYSTVEEAKQLPEATLETYRDESYRIQSESTPEPESAADVRQVTQTAGIAPPGIHATSHSLYQQIQAYQDAMGDYDETLSESILTQMEELIRDTDIVAFVPDEVYPYPPSMLSESRFSSYHTAMPEFSSSDPELNSLRTLYGSLENMFELDYKNHYPGTPEVNTARHKKISDYFRHEYIKNLNKVEAASPALPGHTDRVVAMDIEVSPSSSQQNFIEVGIVRESNRRQYFVLHLDIKGIDGDVSFGDAAHIGFNDADPVALRVLKETIMEVSNDSDLDTMTISRNSDLAVSRQQPPNLEARMFPMGRVAHAMGLQSYQFERTSLNVASERLRGYISTSGVDSINKSDIRVTKGNDGLVTGGSGGIAPRNLPDTDMNVGTFWQSIQYNPLYHQAGTSIDLYNLSQTPMFGNGANQILRNLQDVAANNDIIIRAQFTMSEVGQIEFAIRGSGDIERINTVFFDSDTAGHIGPLTGTTLFGEDLPNQIGIKFTELEIIAPHHKLGINLDKALDKALGVHYFYGEESTIDRGLTSISRSEQNFNLNFNELDTVPDSVVDINEYNINQDIGYGVGEEVVARTRHKDSPMKPKPLRKELMDMGRKFSKTPLGKTIGLAWKVIDIGEVAIATGFKKAQETAARGAIARGLGAAGAAAAAAPIAFLGKAWAIYEIGNLIVGLGQEMPDIVNLIRKRNNVLKNGEAWEVELMEETFWRQMGKEGLDALQRVANRSPAEKLADIIWQPAFNAIENYIAGNNAQLAEYPEVRNVDPEDEIYNGMAEAQQKLDLMQDKVDYDNLYFGYLNDDPNANVLADRTFELANNVYNR
jgi:hypothetical protein